MPRAGARVSDWCQGSLSGCDRSLSHMGAWGVGQRFVLSPIWVRGGLVKGPFSLPYGCVGGRSAAHPTDRAGQRRGANRTCCFASPHYRRPAARAPAESWHTGRMCMPRWGGTQPPTRQAMGFLSAVTCVKYCRHNDWSPPSPGSFLKVDSSRRSEVRRACAAADGVSTITPELRSQQHRMPQPLEW